MGFTASQNCCSCGGGDYVENINEDDNSNEDIPTSLPSAMSPVNFPLMCQDSPVGWYDIDGPQYNCQWYSEDTNCEELGSIEEYKNFGKTASQACCSCNGGEMVEVSPTPPPSPSPTSAICTDIIENWHDIDGETYTVSQSYWIPYNCNRTLVSSSELSVFLVCRRRTMC